MKSWWQLGEGSGFRGDNLSLYMIECPFCFEKGDFSIKNHATKRNPNSSKTLNFDTLKCENCVGYVMVLWSASTSGGIYDYRVLPYPLKTTSAPEHWPDTVQRFWIQTQSSLENQNWDAAAEMARSALQFALRGHKAVGRDLKSEIEDLASKGILPPLMKDWSHEVRELGNDAAHPKLNGKPTTPEDAEDIAEFLDFLLTYLYNLPKQIQEYRERRDHEKLERLRVKRTFKCPDCNVDCTEVKWAVHSDGKKTQDYPKPIQEPLYREYRYFCRKCKKEWIYNNAPSGYIKEMDEEDSQFIFDERKGYLVENKSKD